MPVFVNLLRSPRIDSPPGGPVRQPYLTYRPAWLQRQAESVSWNRFLGSLNVYKYGLCTLQTGNDREYSVGNLRPAMGARNQVGIGLSYWPVSLCSLATQFQTRFLESIPRPIAGLKFSTQVAFSRWGGGDVTVKRK